MIESRGLVFQITPVTRSPDLPILILRLQVARLTAGLAVVLAVFAKPDVVLGLAGAAVSLALTSFFRQVANRAQVFISHARRLARICEACNRSS